jgi:hypothetical protein
MQEKVGRRKTVRNIHNTHQFTQQQQQTVQSLDSAFKRRLTQAREGDGKEMIHCVAI